MTSLENCKFIGKRHLTAKALWIVVFLGVMAVTAQAGAVMTVNWIGNNTTCDDKLTLEEATALGRGQLGRAITTEEKNQISGATWVLALPGPCNAVLWNPVTGIGDGFADDIFFVSGMTNPISSAIVLGKNDDIDGTTGASKVILDGSGRPAGTSGIFIETFSGSQIRNMEIRNFPGSGILAQATSGAIFEGLDIHNNGGSGISLGYNHNAPITNSQNTRIGGDQPQHRNRIYSNSNDGIYIESDLTHDRLPLGGIFILNNLIGTSDGVTASGNGGRGIMLENSFGVTIGDQTGATRNIISGNSIDGITLDGPGAISNLIIGNFIGTSESSGAPLGNGASGIAMLNGAGSTADLITLGPNKIGIPGFGNVVSANNAGIFIADPNTSQNVVQANYVGTNIGGNTDLGNVGDGIYLTNGAFNNQIGGTGNGEGNLIAFNLSGIKAISGTGNAFKRNRIFSNDNLGIDLAPVGPTVNDVNDGDSGPNGLLNFPVITYVNAQTSSVTLSGSLNSTPNQTYTIEFFGNGTVDGTGYGEGRTFLGSTQVTTNASGNAFFNNLSFSSTLSNVGSWVSATTTDANKNTSEFSGARNICGSMLVNPTDVLAPIGGGAANFTVFYSSGCNSYTAQSNVPWITVNSIIAGTVNYTVAANTGPPRDGVISITYNSGNGTGIQNFYVSQNNGCSYQLSHFAASYQAAGIANDGMTLTAGTGCTWTAVSNVPWINITSGSSGSGNGTVFWTVPANTGPARQGTMTIAGQTFTINQAASVVRRAPFDYDGDGKTDASVYRPSTGDWYLLRSTAGFTASHFGASSDILVPADYTGDGKTDIATWRPSDGTWYVLRSENNTFYGAGFGTNGDVPAPGDYDGDGKADLAVYRPGGQAYWYLQQSTAGFSVVPFGVATDLPAPGDFDGDGKADISVYRPSLGQWFRFNSSNGSFYGVQFGAVGDKIVQGDYTGDGKTDCAIFRPSTSTWYVLRSETPTFYGAGFGTAGDLAAPGDYDGDGKIDIAVWRSGSQAIFYAQGSTAGFIAIPWGIPGDRPTPNAYVR